MASSAEWSCGRSPCSLVCWQLLTMWDIVWRLPRWHLLQGPTLCGRMHSDVTLLSPETAYYLCPVSSWQFESWLADSGSSTTEELTTEAYFQPGCHWLVMSMGWVPVQRDLCDKRQMQGAENAYLHSGQSSGRAVFSISLQSITCKF